MKTLNLSLLLALGLLPVAHLAQAAPISNAQLQLDLQQGANTKGEANALIPLAGNGNQVFFAAAQGYARSGQESTYGVGLGYRFANSDASAVYGVNGFYDQQTSQYNKNYNRFSVGVERLALNWELRANYYGYTGNQKNELNRNFIGGELKDLGNGVNAIVLNHLYTHEQVHSGFDIEAGHNLSMPNAMLFIGAYSFGSNLTGGKLRGEYQFGDRYAATFLAQYDQERGTQVYGGLQITLGKAHQATGIHSKCLAI